MEEIFKGVQPHHIGILIVVKLFLDFLKEFLKPLFEKRLRAPSPNNTGGDKFLYEKMADIANGQKSLAEIVHKIEISCATTDAIIKGMQDDISRIESKGSLPKDCH